MNKDCICEKCGNEMIPIDKNIPVGMTCPNCGWGWATTYIDPIIEDNTVYRVVLQKENKASKNSLKVVSTIAKCNYVNAKDYIDNAPVEIFCGKAIEVKNLKEQLDSANISFVIVPDFPY